MRLCFFEDRGVASLEPLTLTRPAFELLCGQTSLGAKQRRHFAASAAGALVRPHLAELCRAARPDTPVNDLPWLRAAPTVLVNARWLPPPGQAVAPPAPCVALVGDEVAYAVLGPERLTYCSANTLDDCLETWKSTLPPCQAGGRLLRYPWELVEHNAEQIRLDFRHAAGERPPAPGHLVLVGGVEEVYVHPAARVEPLVVADTREGPVVIDRDAVVNAFTRLEGPCYVGPGTHVLGAKVRGGTTLGPNCRIGGEVEASIVHGHSNKYHDGFLGHSYVGEWVNLGAGTSNSDLRNDYGEVSVVIGGRRVPTGLTKVGCFLGDHTKTGLGTLLNTGTVAGVFCNLLPSGSFLPKWFPCFCSWWNGGLGEQTDLAALLRTAAEVMRRRGSAFGEAHAALFRALFDQSAPERRRALLDAEQRRLRRSA
jgi:UDP-N-acetylglucosamine diphosphorylase / glucose-1-phosphate thymidylyltransferase / UDP-N-acetylgalactosamine diphosphorylase / glucosamine-1-phosphate N-acetyltransferase / galactosamine-1-phosphate N-acetyltransferase